MSRDGIVALIVACGVAAVFFAIAWQRGTLSGDGAETAEGARALLAAQCEAELKRRLPAPSTYERLEIAEFERRAASYAESRGWMTPEAEAAAARDMAGDEALADLDVEMRRIYRQAVPVHVSLFLRYEAQGVSGVRRQAIVECARVVKSVDEIASPPGFGDELYLDGETAMEWALRNR